MASVREKRHERHGGDAERDRRLPHPPRARPAVRRAPRLPGRMGARTRGLAGARPRTPPAERLPIRARPTWAATTAPHTGALMARTRLIAAALTAVLVGAVTAGVIGLRAEDK